MTDSPSVPVRYRIAPLMWLVVLAVIPVVGLTMLLVWSDNQADAHEAAAAAVPDVPQPAVAPAAELTTSILDARRAPSSLAQVAADTALATSMDQLAAFVDGRSCVTVKVNGRPVSSINGDLPVIPASTNKLLIAGVATEVLGADHRFTTSVAAAAPVEGVVDGDVYLIGGGDPLLVAADLPPGDDPPDPTATTSLDQLADAVVGAGITARSPLIELTSRPFTFTVTHERPSTNAAS